MKTCKKFLSLLLIGVVLSSLFAGCGKKNDEEDVVEIAQNDFAGAYERMTNIQNDILDVCSILDENNYVVMSGNPDDYWSDNGFFFLNLLPIYEEEMKYISLLNEENDFSEIQTYITELLVADGYSEDAIYVEKLDVNKYRVRYEGYFMNPDTLVTALYSKAIEVIYDAETNRFKVSCYCTPWGDFNTESFKVFFCEFAQIANGVFVAQTNKERLYAVYDKEKNLSEFYYTLLDDNDIVNLEEYISMDDSYILDKYGFGGGAYQIPGYDDLYISYLQRGVEKYLMSYKNEDGATCVKPISLSNYALEKVLQQPEYRKYFKSLDVELEYNEEEELVLTYKDGHEIIIPDFETLEKELNIPVTSPEEPEDKETEKENEIPEVQETEKEHASNVYEEVGEDGKTTYTYEIDRMVQLGKELDTAMAAISEEGELLYEDGSVYTKVMICRRYDEEENSIYKNISGITNEWVDEAKFFKKKITYKNGELTIVSKNELTGDLTEFTIKSTVEVTENETMEE